jgi:hypothetical protein
MPEYLRANIFARMKLKAEILGDVVGTPHLEQLRCKN